MIPTTLGQIHEHATQLTRETSESLCLASGKADLVGDASGMASVRSGHGPDRKQLQEYLELMNGSVLTSDAGGSGECVNPGEVIKDTVDLVRALDQNAISIQTRSLPEDLRMPILKSHLQQVVYNVMKHSLEGLSEVDGSVVVAASITKQDPRNSRVRLDCRQALHLTIEAKRPGLPTELRHRPLTACERKNPKEDALRVNHARMLLDQYGGLLRIERLMGHGTRAHIIWPY